MSPARRLPDRPMRQQCRSPLASYVDAFERYLGERDYASQTTATYLGCLANNVRHVPCLIRLLHGM